MTRDEIAQAMQDSAGADWGTEAHFQKFAALVAAAEREACIQKIREELDQAERNSMRLEAQPGVRVSMIEAALDWIRARGGDVSNS
jgi:hypothetical protein